MKWLGATWGREETRNTMKNIRFPASLKAVEGVTPLLSLSNLFHLSSHTLSLGLLKKKDVQYPTASKTFANLVY